MEIAKTTKKIEEETLINIYLSDQHYFNRGNFCIKCGCSISASRDPSLKCVSINRRD